MTFATFLRRATLGLIVLALVTAPALARTHSRAADWAQVWADGVVGRGVAEGRASGAVVTVVEDGRVVALRGYGVADRPGGQPVDPAVTRFQIASVSKTFTGALLAFAVADGRIRGLDDPANLYLRRTQLREAVTLRQLVTHSAGFEERGFAYFAHGRTAIPASAAYVARAMPETVRPPGSRIVYSNIDPALVGVLLEDVSGRTVRDEMQKRLFAPLGMTASELNYAPAGHPDLVRAYADGQLRRGSSNAPYFAPTGSVETTGRDMAAYLNAMLGFRPDVLSPEELAQLFRPLARNHPDLDPLGVFWYLTRWGPHRISEHAGGVGPAGAWVILAPNARIGVFVAWAGGAPPFEYGLIHDSFLTAALGSPPMPPFLDPAPDPTRFVGRYLDERRPQTNAETVFGLPAVKSVSARDGALWIDGKGPYRAVSQATFVLDAPPGRSGDTIVFGQDELIQRTSYSPRVAGLSDPGVQARILYVALALSGALGLLLAAIGPGFRRLLGLLGALGAVAIPMSLYVTFGGPGFIQEMQDGSRLRFFVLATGTVALGLAGALLLPMAILGRASSRGELAWRIAALAGGLAMAAAAVILVGWNVLRIPNL